MKSLNAKANLMSMSVFEEMNENNCDIGGHPNFKLLLFCYFIAVYQPGFHQVNRINRRYILKKALKDTGFKHCGECQTNAEIYRTGCLEGKSRTLWDQLKFLCTGRISSCSGIPQVCSQALFTDQIQDHPDYLG